MARDDYGRGGRDDDRAWRAQRGWRDDDRGMDRGVDRYDEEDYRAGSTEGRAGSRGMASEHRRGGREDWEAGPTGGRHGTSGRHEEDVSARMDRGPRSEWGQGYAGGYGRSADYGLHGGRGAAGFGADAGERGGVYGDMSGARAGMRGPERPSFAGRGPKGYVRPDARIHEDVCEVLTRHRDVDASEVEVRVHEGRVTLAGSVPDKHMKRLAEDLAEECMGVREVENELRVARAGAADREMPRPTHREEAPARRGAGAGTRGATQAGRGARPTRRG